MENKTKKESTPEMGNVIVAGESIFSLVVCVKNGLSKEEIVKLANDIRPCGTIAGWGLVEESADSGNGIPNPCDCDEFSDRKHYLMDC